MTQMTWCTKLAAKIAVFLGMLVGAADLSSAQVERELFQNGGDYLIVEFLDDDLVHFELSAIGPPPALSLPLYTTPMVEKTDYTGPSSYQRIGDAMETAEIRVVVDSASLAVTVTDISKNPELTLSTFFPWNIAQPWKGIQITPESFTHIYGLGQKFYTYDSADGDWVGRTRSPGPFGNEMASWDNGATGNTQFPVAYMAGQGNDAYALFMDNKYRQEWNFQTQPFRAEMWGDWLRWYVLTGDDLKDLRRDYMQLTGRPPVPPKKAFGLWVSEYGYDNWAEMDDKLATLISNEFPVDGFVLDLQWFGGVQPNDYTQMGSLTWDTTNFPNPAGKISDLDASYGVGVVVIEESYIGKALSAHTQMAARGYLAEDSFGSPIYLTSNPWWGTGGYIDWSNESGADFWHDWKREPLILDGILGHWTDLGEPEMYDGNAYYDGIEGDHKPLDRHADVHNLYNLLWSKSIWEGYARHGHNRRPWILSRSGTAGSQRYGVAMWSGDIAGKLSSLTTHMNSQMHLSLSGVDYYGADVGGFHRQSMSQNELDDMYTQWFANACLLDVPLRPHVNNLDGQKETAPDRIGDLEANRDNVRLRYALIPYVYSLAYEAYLNGEPLFPPLVYHFQDDQSVRTIGSQKMLGPHLLMKTVSSPFATSAQIYLPAGTWVDFHSNSWLQSAGQTVTVSCAPNGRFQLPLFARAGAIVPQMVVDQHTANALGLRRNGSSIDDLVVFVVPGSDETRFTLYEDDGVSVAYRQGEFRQTLITQHATGARVEVEIAAAAGTYTGAPLSRDSLIELKYSAGSLPYEQVTLNGAPLMRHLTQAAFEAAASGWFDTGDGKVLAKSGVIDVGDAKIFRFDGTLRAQAHTISAAGGGVIDLYADAGAGNAARTYIILGSMSGVTPGFPLPGGLATLPLNWDFFTDYVKARLNTPLFGNFMRPLSAAGQGTGTLDVPSIPAQYIGSTLSFAYCLASPFDFASNPVAIEVTP